MFAQVFGLHKCSDCTSVLDIEGSVGNLGVRLQLLMGRGLVVYGGSGYSVRNGLAGLPICCHPTLHTARGKQGASIMAMSNGQRGGMIEVLIELSVVIGTLDFDCNESIIHVFVYLLQALQVPADPPMDLGKHLTD